MGYSSMFDRIAAFGKRYFSRPSSARFRIVGAMKTHPGLVRSHNEDSIAYAHFDGRSDARRYGVLSAIADGVGGGVYGEIASRIAVDTVMRTYTENTSESPRQCLQHAFEQANHTIRQQVERQPDFQGMATTCTALAIESDRAVIAHIGDTRAYLWRNGKFCQISEDQSLVARMVRDGLLTAEEARAHPDRNLILAALGSEPTIRKSISITEFSVKCGDIFCLCSDGLSGFVEDEFLGATVSTFSAHQSCEALCEAALAAGGHDNISIGVFRLQPSGESIHRVPPKTKSTKIIEEIC